MDEKFNKIFNTYKLDIFRLIYSYTLNINDSKDILQETFIEYYKNILSLPEEEIIIKKWLIRVAINKSKNYLKCFWKKKILTYDESKEINVFSNSHYEIEEFLNNLDKNYRLPIYLYYYEGYDIKEIANLLNLSESAVKMRLKRAKEILKKEMESV